jgi:predicted metalloendopeptidase
MARFRGDAVRPEAVRAFLESDIHPLGKFRIQSALSNTPEFQQAFACTAGAPMVKAPAARCTVW